MGKRPANKDARKLIARLRKAGYDVTRSSSTHDVVRRNGLVVTSIPMSPSDQRWLVNTRADIRRFERKHGLEQSV